MKRSIKRLPKCTQFELNTLRDLILQHIPKCAKIVLFGSYGRGKGYILYDEVIENDARKSYQSDLDLLIIMPTPFHKITEEKLSKHVLPKYNQILEEKCKRHAPARIIVESMKRVNKNLEISQFFFTEVIKEGVLLYDSGEFKFSKARELSPQEIYDRSKRYYRISFADGEMFFGTSKFSSGVKWYRNGSFQMHQACENYYNTIELVHTHYQPKCHKLEKLAPPLYKYARELADVFPLDNEFQQRCFTLLCEAYTRARYDIDFDVTQEEYEYLTSRVEILRKITIDVCQKHLDFLAQLEHVTK